jgi:perosamine synthetase
MIPVFETVFLGNEKRYVNECLDTGWVSSEGPFVRRFEMAMAERFEMYDAVAVNSGTAALETALYALDLPPGSEVIMPSLTIISCALACLRLSLVPVLVDVDAYAWTVDPAEVETKITSRTGAIMVVHLFGNSADMDPILAVASRHGLPVIEDFAQAHGAGYRSAAEEKALACGGMGEISATSFYANKLISCGEGGMVLCRTPEAAKRARRYRNLGFGEERNFIHEDIAANFRMTNLQAALGLAQLEQLNQVISIKRRIADLYRDGLAGTDELLRFHPVPVHSEPVYWMFCVELNVNNGVEAEHARAALRESGIDSRQFFTGLHRQPVLLRRGLFRERHEFPHTERAGRYAFYLPSAVNLSTDEVEHIAETLVTFLRKG